MLDQTADVESLSDLLAHLATCVRRGPTILADLTASKETVETVAAALEMGCGVVLANKNALSSDWDKARPLFQSSHLRYEVTVGAGLPVISTLRYLLATGDEVERMAGCLSGTLGCICTEMERGISYGEAVRHARVQGYTEPDPRDDLSGWDVVRKALILARTAGWPLEAADVDLQSMIPPIAEGMDTQQFLDSLAAMETPYGRRFADAKARGETLRYVASINRDGGQVGLTPVQLGTPLAALDGPANYVAIHTQRYADVPLVISGPGAGPAVTAAGALGDIIDLATSNDRGDDA
jgi:homoserine dehydrogenase